MSKRLRIVPVTLLALATGACDSFLDVNKNPNAAVDARVDLTFPTVIGVFGHSVLGGSLGFWTTEWMQQFSFNGTNRSYANIHRYEVSETTSSGPWDVSFAGVMNEASSIMARTEATDNDWAYHGIAKFIFAWNYGIVSDAWGPVPFTEAFNAAIRNPKYDEQKVVMEGVHRLIEESIADMQKTAVRKPGENDLLYRGDMAKWVKLARTVQATYHLRLSNAPGENKQDRAQKALTALAQGFQSNADDADQVYPGGNNRRPPWYIFRSIDNFTASAYFVNALLSRQDPRIGIILRPTVSDTPAIVYRGHQSGTPGVTTNTVSRIGNFFAGDSASLNWLSFAHAKFVEAEARLIVSGAAAADAAYRAGIRANMQKLGVPDASIATYLAARPPLGTVANPLEEIMREKYVVNFLNIEVWTDWRRTGYPIVPPVTSEYLTHIPYRIRTPQSELQNNSDNIAATGIPSGLSGMSTKVWWASGS